MLHIAVCTSTESVFPDLVSQRCLPFSDSLIPLVWEALCRTFFFHFGGRVIAEVRWRMLTQYLLSLIYMVDDVSSHLQTWWIDQTDLNRDQSDNSGKWTPHIIMDCIIRFGTTARELCRWESPLKVTEDRLLDATSNSWSPRRSSLRSAWSASWRTF